MQAERDRPTLPPGYQAVDTGTSLPVTPSPPGLAGLNVTRAGRSPGPVPLVGLHKRQKPSISNGGCMLCYAAANETL
jgi:hypothetical protein